MTPSLAISLYCDLVRARLVEEAIADRYAEQEMRCPVHLSIGQEAAAVGVCAALDITDRAMSAHRAHAHYLSKGGDLRQMIAELYGKATGCTRGKGGSMHLVDLSCGFMGSTPIVGGSLPVAVGLALADKMAGNQQVTVAFIGEAATEEGVVPESLNFAVLQKLPVIIVCEDNLYSSYTPIAPRQPSGRDRVAIARAHGCLAFSGDGNKVDEVHQLAQTAVAHARSGRGPVYLDLKTYRWREHCGPNYDNDLGYRTPEEAEEWMTRCPVAYWENTVIEQGYLSEQEMEGIRREILTDIDDAFTRALNAPYPQKEELSTHVYALPRS